MKKRDTYLAFLCLCACCLTPLVMAADGPLTGPVEGHEATVYSEQAVVDMALEYNQKLKTFTTNVQIADYRQKSAGRLDNPELRLSDLSVYGEEVRSEDLEIGLNWSPPRPGELRKDRQQATVRSWELKVRKKRYHQQLVSRIRRNYATVLMYDEQAELAKSRVLRENDRIRLIQQLVELGNRSIVYQMKAKMWQTEAQNEQTRIIQKRGLVRRELSKRSGMPEDAAVQRMELPEVLLDVEDLLVIALDKRPEFELVRQRIELAVLQNQFERKKRLPWPSDAELSHHWEDGEKRNWLEFKIDFELPIFNRNSGNIKATNLAVRKKEGESETIRESIEDEVRLAYTVYKDLLLDWKNFSLYTEEILTSTQVVIDQAREHKVVMPDEILEMELTIIEARKLLSEKRRDLAHALVDLCYAVGAEDYSELE